jgi:transposase InsO family protein
MRSRSGERAVWSERTDAPCAISDVSVRTSRISAPDCGALAGLRSRWGYRRLHVLLQREVGRINHKRVYRLYREERLALRRRKRKRVAVPLRGVVDATSTALVEMTLLLDGRDQVREYL